MLSLVVIQVILFLSGSFAVEGRRMHDVAAQQQQQLRGDDSQQPPEISSEKEGKIIEIPVPNDGDDSRSLDDMWETGKQQQQQQRGNDNQTPPELSAEEEEKIIETPVPVANGGSSRRTLQDMEASLLRFLQKKPGSKVDIDSLRELAKRNDDDIDMHSVNLDLIASTHPAGRLRNGQASLTHSCDDIRAVPSNLRTESTMWKGIPNFYQKYTEAYGIPIIGSSSVQDRGLRRICYVVAVMLSGRYDIRNAYYKLFGRVALIADNEQQTTLPEYSTWDSSYWDGRARGLGATTGVPTTSVGDDNARCSNNRYPTQDIFVHEFGHGLHLMAGVYVIKGFARDMYETFGSSSGLWSGTYAGGNMNEWFATGCQFYLGAVNGFMVKSVSTRATLRSYDRGLYNMVEKMKICAPLDFIERCQYTGQTQTPEVKQFCASGPEGTARCEVAASERKQIGPDGINKWQCKKIGGCFVSKQVGCVYPKTECQDTSFGCASMAMNGDCTRNPVYMTLNCPFACNMCAENAQVLSSSSIKRAFEQATCQDTNPSCHGWNNRGFCTDARYQSFMNNNCKLMCSDCSTQATMNLLK